jgi:hypothetical protein
VPRTLHWHHKFGVQRQWLATIIEPMFEVYVVLFISAALALTGWWILRKSVPTRQSAGGTERSASRNIIGLCAVLLIIVGGLVAAFITSARFPTIFLLLGGSAFVRMGWWIYRTFIPSKWFGDMGRPISRRIASIFATTMIFAGVFAVIFAAAIRFLAISHVIVPSVIASCAVTWILRPRGATAVSVLPEESTFIPQVVGLFLLGLVCTALLAGGTLLWVITGFDRPNDRWLARRFNDQRADYERLASMMAEDHNMAIVASELTPRNDADSPGAITALGISVARWNDYRALLKRTGVNAVLRRDSGNIALDVWSNVFIHGTHLSYMHCGSRDTSKGRATLIWPCVETKDIGNGEDSSFRNGFVYTYRYKKIAQDWYILQVSY